MSYTSPIQDPQILCNQSYKQIVDFPTFNKPVANALSVFYYGGVTEANVILSWNLYNISEGTYEQIASGDETIEGGNLTTFLSDINSRFYIVAQIHGLTLIDN